MRGQAPDQRRPTVGRGHGSVMGCAVVIGGGEIFDDLWNIHLIDRRAVEFYHLGYLGLPKILLVFRSVRLGVDVISGVTARAIILHHLKVWPGPKRRTFIRKRLGVRCRLRLSSDETRDGDSREREREARFH